VGLPWSIEKILGWRSQLDAVRRWAKRCEACYFDGRCVSDDFEDFYFAFMVSCFHLRDFAVQTGGIRKKEIDGLIQASESMRLCRDICNRTKHHTLTHRVAIDAQWSIGREYPRAAHGASGVSHFLIAGGEKRNPLQVMRDCLGFWDNLVSRGGLSEQPDPFGHP
jgi:hypothetical protein